MNISWPAKIILVLWFICGVASVAMALGYEAWWRSGIFALGFTLLFAISAIFIDSIAGSTIAIFIPGLTAVYWLPRSFWVWGALLVSFIFMWLGFWFISAERTSTLGTRPRHLLAAGLPMFLTGVALAGALFYYTYNQNPSPASLIPRPAFDLILPHIVKSMESIVPAAGPIDPNARVSDLFEGLILRQVEGKDGVVPFISAADMKLAVRLQRESWEKTLGFALTGEERIGDVLYRVATDKATSLVKPYAQFLGLAVAVGVFFALKTVSIFAYWLILLLVYIFTVLGKLLGLIKQEDHQITVRRQYI